MTLPSDLNELVAILAAPQTDGGADPETRADALQRVLDAGPDAIPALLEGLNTDYIAYVQRAVVGVGFEAVDPLLEVVRTSDEALIRANAALILGKLGDERATAGLIDALEDADALVRKEAAQALAAFKDAQMVLPLCILLEDDAPDVRSSAAMTLGKQGDGRAIEALNDAFLRDDDERVRRAAQDAMRKIDTHAQQETVATIGGVSATRAADALQKPHEERDTEEIQQKAQKQEKLFHTFGIPRVELLLATLESTDHTVQRRAVRELIKMGDEVVDAILTGLDQTENEQAMAHMVFALGELKAEKALPVLETFLSEDGSDLHYAAEHAIAKIQGTAE